MTQESASGVRELTVLVRVDGHGELRDQGRVTRMHAANADELRGMLMERALTIAFDEGVDINVITIDVDGIYDLLCTPTGQVDEVGEMRPLQPGDNDLTPEAPTRQTDGGYAALFGLDTDEPSSEVDAPTVPVHETERLPREEMMAKLDYDELLRGEEVAHDDEAELSTEGMFEDAPGKADSQASAAASEGDRAQASANENENDDASEASGADSAADDDADSAADEDADADELDDEFHDEGLDHDFDELDDAETPDADRPEDADAGAGDALAEADAEAEADADADADDALAEAEQLEAAADDDRNAIEATADSRPLPWRNGEEPSDDEEEWQPKFLRGRDAASSASDSQKPGRRSPAAERAANAAAAVASEHGSGSGDQPVPPRPEHRPNTEGVPTLDDFFAEKTPARQRPAEEGWRRGLRRVTGGLIKLGPGARERNRREEIAAIQRSFMGPRTIVVMNPKGGAHKTTATLMIAATFGTMRGGYTLAWDNNETRGTLGWRSKPGVHTNTAVDLLRELPRFEISGGMTIADVDRFVRNQGDAKFDVLASDDDAASAAIIDDDAFSRLHTVLSRFYRIMVIDTGNNMRASNWEAALDVADQLVIVSTAREDTAASAAWLADGLRERGYGRQLSNAVTILSSPSEKEDTELTQKLTSHFQQLTRAVVSVPYDQEFVGGGELDIPSLQPATLAAWRHAAAVIAQGL